MGRRKNRFRKISPRYSYRAVLLQRNESCAACSERLNVEILFCNALRALMQEKAVLSVDTKKQEPYIVSYFHVLPNSDFDALGKIDFLVMLSNQIAIPVQVKSSKGGMTFHANRYPHIPSIQLLPQMAPDEVRRRTEQFLLSVLRDAFLVFSG